MLVYQAVAACEFFIGKKPDDNVSESIITELVNENENIVFTGMPGSGKSTIGKELSASLKKEFIDTDALIVEREKREISDIFATDGEAYFGNVEKEVIKEVSLRKNVIISTGGGCILNPENIKNLKANGRIFFLDRKPEDLVPTDDRPLANEKSKIMKLYEERLPIYQKTADYIINGEVGISQTVQNIIGKI
jgi:shikimate dehydrogenase